MPDGGAVGPDAAAEPAGVRADDAADGRPPHATAVLSLLILGAVVANTNIAIASSAMPTIGRAFGADQAALDLAAGAYVLGLAASVLYLGALSDRYGRRRFLVLGSVLCATFGVASAFAPSIGFLFATRLCAGAAAGMVYPTTLSLITALFRGRARTTAITLWTCIGGGFATLGPVIGGLLLRRFWWGSVFLFPAVLAPVLIVGAFALLPSHAAERTTRVDHLGGVVSVCALGPFVAAIAAFPVHGFDQFVMSCLAVSIVAAVIFVWRERRTPEPLIDLALVRMPTFWVAWVAGCVLWGTLNGARFIGQEYLQYVGGYDPLQASFIAVPASIFIIATARPAAKLGRRLGGRAALATGLGIFAAAFVVIVAAFGPGTTNVEVAVVYLLAAPGLALAAPAASAALMQSVPLRRVGMGSSTNDLTRDFGGALFQSLMGTVLALRYGHALGSVANAASSPQGRVAFTAGAKLGLWIACGAALGALGLVLACFPRPDAEAEVYAAVAAEAGRT